MDAQTRGAKAQAVGATFEDETNRYCDQLLRSSLAYIQQSYPKLRYMGQKIGFKPGQRGEFDRWGSLFTGRAIYFELKHRTAKDIFIWSADDDHQMKALRAMCHVTQGMALCFVLFDWEWKGTKEMRLHWVTDIIDRQLIREQGIWIKNRQWFETLDNSGLVELPNADQQYRLAAEDPRYQRLATMWANDELAN